MHVQAAAIAPSVIEVRASRGSIAEEIVQIINTGATDQKYYMGVMKFVPREETGTPQFISYNEDHSGLPLWIHFPVSEVVVPANTKVDVPFQIILPDDIPSGGYYAAVTVSQAPFDVVATNGAAVEAKTASLVLLTVEGETVITAALLDFSGDFNNGKLEYEYRIQNQGNVHVKPEGEVTVRNLFGKTILSTDANPAGGRVLPSSTRLYKGEAGETKGFVERGLWQLRYLVIGPVQTELRLEYEGGKQIFERQKGMVFPWEAILLSVSGVIILVLVARGLRKR